MPRTALLRRSRGCSARAPAGTAAGLLSSWLAWLAGVLAITVPGLAPAQPAADGTAAALRRGAEVHARCLGCHALAADRTGPRHCGLIGRRAGSLAGTPTSAALRASGLVWDAATLDRFLAAPDRVVPGTTMTYAGLPDPRERADLIAYLAHAATEPPCRPRP